MPAPLAREDQRGGRVGVDMRAEWWQDVGMNTTVRGIPREVYDRLKQQAARERRSLNGQILHILEQATDTEETQR